MNNLIRCGLLVVGLGVAGSVAAQQGKFKIIGFEKNETCPIFASQNKKTGETFYDSRVIGYPRFFPGYVVMLNGERLEGNIAVFNQQTTDWAFVKRCMLLIPEGKEIAQYIGGGVAIEIFQDKKKEQTYYDLYDGGYLERLVSGKLRLSFNPNANTTRNISGFISKSFTDSLRRNVAENSIKRSLESGKSVEESLAIANVKDQAISIGSAIEIIDKEYLLYNEASGETKLITRANYEQVLTDVFKTCSAISEKDVKGFLKKYDQITDAIETYNKSCN